MDLGLTAKRAMITGGSRGIGFATARILAEEGCDLILVSQNADGLRRAAQQLRDQTGRDVATCQCDMADAAQVAELAAKHALPDILINNAGAVPPGSLAHLTTEAIRDSWAAKVFGYMGLIERIYPAMQARKSGVIVNVIGSAGHRPNAEVIALSAGNAALVSMTQALGAEAPDHGVRVLGVSPGATATDRSIAIWKARAARELGDEARWPEMARGLPFGRAADPEEVANVIAFLASPLGSYVSGCVVTVDGGKSLRS